VAQPAAEPVAEAPSEPEVVAPEVAEPEAPAVAEEPAAEPAAPTHEEAVANVQAAIGATVVTQPADDQILCGQPGGVAAPTPLVEGCGKAITDLGSSQIRVSKIQYGRHLCPECFATAKKKAA
jgi:hypothetical protein